MNTIRSHIHIKHIAGLLAVMGLLGLAHVPSFAQETTPAQLERIEVDRPQQRASSSRADSGQGFGYDQSIPSGQPISDYPLTPSEVISPTRSAANIATVPSAISVVDNQGITAQGQMGIGDMVRGVPGTWASGYAGNSFNSQISMRGFSQTPAVANRVAVLLDSRNMEMPRNDSNTSFLFPEIIDRIEVMRGDGTVQFGNKAIGGSMNILLKKPRQNPGVYFGVEGGSWRTQREWASINLVNGPFAAGIFLGNYNQEGFRLYEGNGINQEYVSRPGPWELLNAIGNVNWKIAPKLSLDLTYMYTKQRMSNPNFITANQWDRRDVRNVDYSRASGGPEERWDAITIGQLYYDGGAIGCLDVTASYRTYDIQNYSYMSNRYDFYGTGVSYQRWLDSGISWKYTRTDNYDFIRNDLTLGTDLWDGRFGRRQDRWKHSSTATAHNYELEPLNETSSYRTSIGNYIINQTRFWDRLIVGLAYRDENYAYRDLRYQVFPTTYFSSPVLYKSYPSYNKSASQYSLNVVYDKSLGSSVYYKHSRTYRFPTLTDMINTSQTATSHPVKLYPLVPEEGTLDECGIRHWFTPNIYLSAIYYELDMDNEIMGEWDVTLANPLRWNANVPNVQHTGLEVEGMLKITPRWKLDFTFTKQKVIYGADGQFKRSTSGNAYSTGRGADAWVPVNPAQMYNATLSYDNVEWGFSAALTYRYYGRRYFQADDLNQQRDLDEVKIGDFAISQTLFDGNTSIYFGVKNFNDCMSAFNSYWDAASYGNGEKAGQIWPDAGRTYYMGLKSNLDFNRMRLPTLSDLNRIQTRLYGAANDTRDTFTGMGSWIRSAVSF